MALFNPSNQLLQIDTGAVSTYLYNSSGAFAPWAGLGENQVLGQRYFGVGNATAANPSGAPRIFMLVEYLSTSAITTANLTTAAAPAPVYWTDETYTTVSGISTEASGTTSTLLPALYVGQYRDWHRQRWNCSYCGGSVGFPNTDSGGWLSQGSLCSYHFELRALGTGSRALPEHYIAIIVAGTAPGYRTLGVQATAVASGLCDVLVNCDII